MTDQERLAVIVPRLAETLRAVAVETGLTNEELLAGLAFLTEVGKADEFILLSDVLGLSRLVDDQTHLGRAGTASNVLGPFYVPGAPLVDNPGSIRAAGEVGEPLVVHGTVTDARTGRPLAEALVDVWQADGDGVYSNETGGLAPWNLRGRQRTSGMGTFEFDTVRPLHYTVKHDGPVGRLLESLGRHPWRPAHVHFLVTAEGYGRVVTQAYLAAGPYLDDDTIDGVKDELIVPIVDGRLRFDIALPPNR
jgi:protocatechuate 3,4-dioxygenase beta subunit